MKLGKILIPQFSLKRIIPPGELSIISILDGSIIIITEMLIFIFLPIHSKAKLKATTFYSPIKSGTFTGLTARFPHFLPSQLSMQMTNSCSSTRLETPFSKKLWKKGTSKSKTDKNYLKSTRKNKLQYGRTFRQEKPKQNHSTIFIWSLQPNRILL